MGTGSAKQLYDSYLISMQTATHYENLWSNLNIIYILISVVGAAFLGIITLAVTDKKIWLKVFSSALAFTVALSSGLNAAFHFSDTANKYGDFMMQLQVKASEYRVEHEALNINSSAHENEESKLTTKYANVLTIITTDMNSIKRSFGTTAVTSVAPQATSKK